MITTSQEQPAVVVVSLWALAHWVRLSGQVAWALG